MLLKIGLTFRLVKLKSNHGIKNIPFLLERQAAHAQLQREVEAPARLFAQVRSTAGLATEDLLTMVFQIHLVLRAQQLLIDAQFRSDV